MLVILARDNRRMHWLLTHDVTARGIPIIIDRRYGEHRRTLSALAVEGRAGDRRVRRIDDRLRDFGWALVDADVTGIGAGVTTPRPSGTDPDEERCATCGQAILAGEGRYRRVNLAFHVVCYERPRVTPSAAS
jgi:hypothetical protein